MRIVFFGTPELAVPSLVALSAAHEIVAVVCQTDKPQGRSGKPVPPTTKVWAVEHGIPVIQPTKLNDGTFEAWLREQNPDIAVLVAYGRSLKQPILDVPKHGFLNLHPSLLPRHRGPSPIQTAILEGDSVTGVSVMRLDAGMDTGDLLLQEEAEILPDDTTASLSDRLAEQGAVLLVRGVQQIANGDAVFTPQRNDGVTVTRLYQKHDGAVRWAASAHTIHNLVRAAIPWPVAHCNFKGAICRLCKTMLYEVPLTVEALPGTVVQVDARQIIVATGEGFLAILEIQMPGKRAMAVADFLRGHTVSCGDRFEDIA